MLKCDRTMRKIFKKGFLKSDGGAAAIEAVFIIPFMAIVYLGTQDVTSLIVFNKKMTDVATAVSDTVSQYKSTIRRSDVTDIENSIKLIMPSSAAATNVQVDVYDYYLNGSTVTKRWSTKSPNATNCAAPATTNFSKMMVPGNDVIVAVSCMKYTPWVTTLFGNSMLGASSFTLKQSITAVPYASKVLNCYTGSSGTTPCAEI